MIGLRTIKETRIEGNKMNNDIKLALMGDHEAAKRLTDF